MATVRRLTKDIVKKAPVLDHRYDIFDDEIHSLCIRVSPSGEKRWALFYRSADGTQRRSPGWDPSRRSAWRVPAISPGTC